MVQKMSNGTFNMTKRACGEQCKQAKLTSKQVKQIQFLYSTGQYSWKKLGLFFGVTKSTIGAILTGRNWKHIK